jgi:hypothetical protein
MHKFTLLSAYKEGWYCANIASMQGQYENLAIKKAEILLQLKSRDFNFIKNFV